MPQFIVERVHKQPVVNHGQHGSGRDAEPRMVAETRMARVAVNDERVTTLLARADAADALAGRRRPSKGVEKGGRP